MAIYSPAEDSYLLEKWVKKLAKNKSVLDIGTGSGILAKAAIKSGAKSVLATDINPEAVNKLIREGINALKSDLFTNVKGKFDLIIFNPPYLPQDKKEPKDSAQTTTGGKRGDEIILHFIKQAPKHLNKNGIILIIISSLIPHNKIIKLLNHLSLTYQILDTKNLFFEILELWEIRKK